jgi:hypothetical protein
MKLILKFGKDFSVQSRSAKSSTPEITEAELAMMYWRWEDYKKGQLPAFEEALEVARASRRIFQKILADKIQEN